MMWYSKVNQVVKEEAKIIVLMMTNFDVQLACKSRLFIEWKKMRLINEMNRCRERKDSTDTKH